MMDTFQDVDLNTFPPRPVAEFSKFVEVFQGHGERTVIKETEIFDVGLHSLTPKIYLILDGEFHVHRRSDSLIISRGNAPAFCGLIEFIRQRGYHYCEAVTTCTALVVDGNVALQVINDNNLWKEFSTIMMWYVQMLSVRDEHLVGVSAYSMIRNKLNELMGYPIERRRNISVASYVIATTMLSRSTIMRILAALIEGKYITIEHGKLIDVKKLPDKY